MIIDDKNARFTDVQRQADGVVRGNIEITILREQAAVVVEFAHVDFRLVSRAETQSGPDLGLQADPETDTGRGIVVVITQVRGIGGENGEVAEALGLESLVGEDRADTPGTVLGKLGRVGCRNEQLCQVDAGRVVAVSAGKGHEIVRSAKSRGNEKSCRPALVFGVHAAVAVDRDAQAAILVVHPVVAELRNQEHFVVTIDALVTVTDTETTLTRCRITLIAGCARRRVTAHRGEKRGADIIALALPDHAGGVVTGGQRILGVGHAGSGKALVESTDTVGEISVGGPAADGQQQQQQ